jgi:hypothetical protein
MKTLRHLCTILAILFFDTVFCQSETDDNTDKIANVVTNYFDLEREAIHLHTDKTSFLNNETIWYQGYIINRKTNKPYFTTNIFVLLFDEKGVQLSEKLVYATNGVFSGKIELNPEMKSGKYYIQVFTNWMNNFTENESTITSITIIDPSEGIKNYKKINPESLEVFLNPEGKSLIKDIPNIVGIQVKDCRGNSPEDLEATIQKSNGEVLKTIKLNRFGYGRFDIIPTDENLKIIVKYGEKIIEKTLQKADLIGLSIEVNTFSIQNKTAIKIKTNKQSFDAFQSKKLNLIIHQDQKISSHPFQFKADALEQTIIINNENLPSGINTIRIIDSDLKQWSERLIYINPLPQNNFNILKNNNTNDRINLIGYSNSPSLIMSVSILPEDTKSIDENNSIVSGMMINPYLTKPLNNSNYYTNAPNRLKMYELDLALLNEDESKYKWDYMKINVPASNYTFDVGLSLKGKIDAAIKDKIYHKVKMIAYKDRIMMSADVSETGDYEFQHLLLTDSSLVKLSLEKLPNFVNVASNLYPKVLNRKRNFNKPILNYIGQNCTDLVLYEAISAFEFPKFNGKIVKLDEVVVKKKTLELSRAKMLSNSMLRGYKIDETNNHGSLLNFIEMNGFRVTRNLGDVYISSRQRMSVNAASPTPLVYIDDRVLFSSYNELDIMQMTEIDEIYIDSHKIGASMNNNVGIIKIYTKKPQNNLFSKPDPNSFFVKEAYSLNYPFKNSDYQNTQNKGFDNFGILGWSALIKTNENGDFMFDLVDYNKPKCKIILEGMTAEGEVYHQEKIIDLK